MDMETVLDGMRRQRDSIHKEHKWNDPVSLSDTATKLATYNSYLADHLAPLHKQATDAAGKAFRTHKELGVSDTGAEVKARFDSTKEREDYENVKFIYSATDNLIKVIQTRIKVIENQIKTEGRQ